MQTEQGGSNNKRPSVEATACVLEGCLSIPCSGGGAHVQSLKQRANETEDPLDSLSDAELSELVKEEKQKLTSIHDMDTAEWRAKYEKDGAVDLWVEEEFNAGSRLVVRFPPAMLFT